MKILTFNFRPDVAEKAIDTIVEQIQKDSEAPEEHRKLYEDIKTLVHFGASTLQKEPLKTVPAEPGNNKKS